MNPLRFHTDLFLYPEKNLLVDRTTGKATHLEPRLTEMLTMLVQADGAVVSRKKFIEDVWDNYTSGEQLLTHSVAMLRKKVGADLIRTVPKKGYYLQVASSKPLSSSRMMAPAIVLKKYWPAVLVSLVLLRWLLIPHHF